MPIIYRKILFVLLKLSIVIEIEKYLRRVRNPARYIDSEINAIKKDPESAEVKIALCFPDVYEIGISHLGHKLLYHILNNESWIFCDRSYAPWLDFAQLLEKDNTPLFSWEKRIPLKEFDLLGFTLPNELCYSNVLFMLRLAQIPITSEERLEGNFPLILGGGPCASNPEPIWKFFDAFFFGEADQAIVEIARIIRDWKKNGDGKKISLLKELAKIQGIYVPAFYQPRYENNRFCGLGPKEFAPFKIKRRIVPDLDELYFPTAQLVPFPEAIHDRLVVEIARGCTRGCRFCHAGIVYRPYRERSLDNVLKLVREGLKKTGYEECSFLSLSAGDYSQIEQLIVRTIVEHWDKRIAVSLPSLRVTSLTSTLLTAIKKVRKTGFTIAPEAGTERLRKIINKPITNDEIFKTCEKVLKAGWRSLKLYFMVGLPLEEEADRKAIVELCRQISALARRIQPSCKINLSISGFVPKPHTPFQWERQLDIDELCQIRSELKKNLARGRLRFRFEDPKNTFLEGVFSRAGRELAEVIELAHKKGVCFDGWSDQFKFDLWIEAFDELGIDPNAYLKERKENIIFPWEHLDSGVSKEFLLAERKKARQVQITEDCRLTGCIYNCGVCDHRQILPKVQKKPSPAQTEQQSEKQILAKLNELLPQPELYFRYLVRYRRVGELRFLGLLENNRIFTRAVRRAGLPMRYTQGFHPMPRISFGIAPPVGVESECEYLELELIEHLPIERIKNHLQKVMPEGIEIVEVREISRKAPSITQLISLIEYEVKIPDRLISKFPQEKLEQFNKSTEFIIKQKREKRDRELDLKQKIKFIEKPTENTIKFGVIIAEGAGVKPQEVIAGIFGLNEEEICELDFKRTFVHFREHRPVSYPADAVRGRRVDRFRRS